MKVSVWDTYVHRNDGLLMHFDIVVPSSLEDADTIFGYGKTYLGTKSFQTGELTSKECRFCHIEQASEEMVRAIEEQGFYIIEMENCVSFN